MVLLFGESWMKPYTNSLFCVVAPLVETDGVVLVDCAVPDWSNVLLVAIPETSRASMCGFFAVVEILQVIVSEPLDLAMAENVCALPAPPEPEMDAPDGAVKVFPCVSLGVLIVPPLSQPQLTSRRSLALTFVVQPDVPPADASVTEIVLAELVPVELPQALTTVCDHREQLNSENRSSRKTFFVSV